MRANHRLRSLIVLAAGVLCAACATVITPPAAAPDIVVQQGVFELKTGRYESALAVFHAAADGLTPNPTAVFYEGVALNRLGRFDAALERLDRAAAMGLQHPDVAFESGWSLLALGRPAEAIARLERFEAVRPGRGKASELLGRAYLAAWRPDEAEAELKDAMDRDPALMPGAFFYLAVLAYSRNDVNAARSYVLALLASASETRLSLVVPQTAAPAPPPPAAPPARYVKATFANVRQAPGLPARVIGVLKGGTRLAVLGEENGWYRVQLGDRQGWIAASVTALEPAAVAAAVAATARRLDAVALDRSVARFALDPNPALLARFDADTAPLPMLDEEGSALHRFSETVWGLMASLAEPGLPRDGERASESP